MLVIWGLMMTCDSYIRVVGSQQWENNGFVAIVFAEMEIWF